MQNHGLKLLLPLLMSAVLPGCQNNRTETPTPPEIPVAPTIVVERPTLPTPVPVSHPVLKALRSRGRIG